jgi:flagellin
MTTISSNVSALLAQRFLRGNAAEPASNQGKAAGAAPPADNGAGVAVAASARGDARSFAAAASAIQDAAAAGMVAMAAGEAIGTRLGDMRAKVAQLADDSLPARSRAALNLELFAMVGAVNEQLAGAAFNGANLLSGAGDGKPTAARPDGASMASRANDVRPLALGAVGGVADAAKALLAIDAFRQSVDSALRNIDGDLTQLRAQSEAAQQAGAAAGFGLGALVDADLARESASLASLQVRQQLSGSGIGIANQTPSALLSLLR